MRAFLVAGRAILAFYNDMFIMTAMSLLWWITGGIFMAAAAAAGLILFMGNGPVWMAPLLAIPAGPALLALAAVVRQTTRGRAADRHDYFNALKTYWKPGLALNALGMAVLSMLLLSLIFYTFQTNPILRLLGILCAYLVLFWLSLQLYVYPFYLALEKPSLKDSLRMSALAVFANPFFSTVLLLVALALTGISTVLVILLVIAWPTLMALTGEHALGLLLERAGVKQED